MFVFSGLNLVKKDRPFLAGGADARAQKRSSAWEAYYKGQISQAASLFENAGTMLTASLILSLPPRLLHHCLARSLARSRSWHLTLRVAHAVWLCEQRSTLPSTSSPRCCSTSTLAEWSSCGLPTTPGHRLTSRRFVILSSCDGSECSCCVMAMCAWNSTAGLAVRRQAGLCSNGLRRARAPTVWSLAHRH
jgi:hypothetical protein